MLKYNNGEMWVKAKHMFKFAFIFDWCILLCENTYGFLEEGFVGLSARLHLTNSSCLNTVNYYKLNSDPTCAQECLKAQPLLPYYACCFCSLLLVPVVG